MIENPAAAGCLEMIRSAAPQVDIFWIASDADQGNS